MTSPWNDATIKLKFLTPERVEEAAQLQTTLSANGIRLSLPEIAVKKEWMTSEQARALNIYLRYEDLRADDMNFGGFMIFQGLVPEIRVRECLDLQRGPYEEGKNFPRLHELLLQKGFVNRDQLQVIWRARVQMDAGRKAPVSESETLPALKIAEAPTAPASPPPKPTPAPQPRPKPKFPVEGGILIEGLKVTLRRIKLKGGAGDGSGVGVVDVEGVLDAHTFSVCDQYLSGLMDNGINQIILNLQRVDYISSAGIGVLAGAVKRCRDSDGDLRLCYVNDKVKKIINLVGLQAMLRIYDEERGAVMSFKYL